MRANKVKIKFRAYSKLWYALKEGLSIINYNDVHNESAFQSTDGYLYALRRKNNNKRMFTEGSNKWLLGGA